MAAIDQYAPIWYDGFDEVTQLLGDTWTGAVGTTSAVTPFGFGRSLSPNNSQTTFRSFASNYAAVMFMGNYRTGNSFTSSTDFNIFHLGDNGADTGNNQIGMNIGADGEWHMRRGNTTLTPANTVGAFASTSTWYNICLLSLFHASAGTVHVFIDGRLIMNFTGDTITTANAYFNLLALMSGGATGTQWDDVALWAADTYTISSDVVGTVGPNGTYPGPCRVVTSWPTGAGNQTQMTPNTGLNWAAAGETTQDGDGTYVLETTAGQYDLYTIEAFPFTPLHVYSSQIVNTARHDTASASEIKAVLRDDGDTDRFGTALTISSSYTQKQHFWHKNPNGTVEWTKPMLDACEMGQECESLS